MARNSCERVTLSVDSIAEGAGGVAAIHFVFADFKDDLAHCDCVPRIGPMLPSPQVEPTSRSAEIGVLSALYVQRIA